MESVDNLVDTLGVTVRFEDVTPMRAAEWLRTVNTHNRNIRPAKVRAFAAAMRRGEWKKSHQGIAFDANGILCDGQHRLAAIVESNVTVRMMITCGLPVESFDTIDIVLPRTPQDFLQVHGEEGTNILSPALAWEIKYETGMMTNVGFRPTPAQLFETLENHPRIRESMKVRFNIKPAKLIPAGLSTFLYYQFSLRDAEAADKFFYRVGRGEDLAATSAEFALRRKLVANATSMRRPVQYVTAAYVIKAWNASQRGETIGAFRYTNDETFPNIAGVVPVNRGSYIPVGVTQ